MEIDRYHNIVPSRHRNKNIFEHDNVKYRIQWSNDARGGPHSSILEAVREDRGETCIIKFCKYPINDDSKKNKIERFKREIQALRDASLKEMDHIIQFVFQGSMVIDERNYIYYVMEKANGGDLKRFIYETELDTAEKLRLCLEILNGIKQLHGMGIYHRDIKPKNILLVDRIWKIADLGLIALRGEDHDNLMELVGPVGWLSPEATNKAYTEGRAIGIPFDCVIDERSDIFQLGKLFWFIFQGNVPIGQLRGPDFRITDSEIFEILNLMLQHDKQQRISLIDIEQRFKPIAKRYSVQ